MEEGSWRGGVGIQVAPGGGGGGGGRNCLTLFPTRRKLERKQYDSRRGEGLGAGAGEGG